jgi:hypothetical protein
MKYVDGRAYKTFKQFTRTTDGANIAQHIVLQPQTNNLRQYQNK